MKIYKQLGIKIDENLENQIEYAYSFLEMKMKELPKAPKGFGWGMYANGKLDLIMISEEE